jgi:hypothetical protein
MQNKRSGKTQLIIGGIILAISTFLLGYGLVQLYQELIGASGVNSVFGASGWAWVLGSICCISPIGGMVLAVGLRIKRKKGVEVAEEAG